MPLRARLAFPLLFLAACQPAADTDDTPVDDTGGDTDDPPVGSSDFVAIDDAPESAFVAGVSIAIDDDGTVYVSWVDDRRGSGDVWLTRSTDDGATWSPSVQIDGDEDVYSADWSFPRLSIGTDDIAWIGAQRGPKVVGRQAPKATLDFGPPVSPAGVTEMGHGALTDADELWLTWLAYPASGGSDLMIGNPTLGYEAGAVKVNAGLGNGVTCECCPLELQMRADGTPMVAWRDNVDDVRNIGFAAGSPNYGMPTDPVYATTTDWVIYACPTQGPRLLELADGHLLLLWSEEGTGYIADSADGGVTWSAERPVRDEGDRGYSPVAAVSPTDGTVYAAFKGFIGGAGTYVLAESADGGQSFSPAEPVTPSDDAGQLVFVELAAGAGRVGLVGVGSADNRLYFRWVE